MLGALTYLVLQQPQASQRMLSGSSKPTIMLRLGCTLCSRMVAECHGMMSTFGSWRSYTSQAYVKQDAYAHKQACTLADGHSSPLCGEASCARPHA